ncbi:MAG: hypothetical protein QM499_12100 [Flavobacteriaceae bacterium]
MKISRPILKPIDSIIGYRDRGTIRNYLTSIFQSIGFEFDDEGIAFAKYKGVIDGQEIKIAFTILMHTRYKGFHQDHLVKYRVFKGIRMRVVIPKNNLFRFIVSKKTKGFLLKTITKVVMKYKGYKKIKLLSANDVYPEVWSPNEKFAASFIKSKEIEQLLIELAQKKTKTISWGIIIEPKYFSYNSNFSNLDEFETNKLKKRLENIIKMIRLSDSISTSN